MRRLGAALATFVVAALAVAASASGSPRLLHGIMDDAQVLGSPDAAFATMGELRPEVIRITLSWNGVAAMRPVNPSNHLDPAYEWGIYDRAVVSAAERNITVVFTIFGTPAWANGGRSRNVAPVNMSELRAFAYAAASRYSGSHTVEFEPGRFVTLPRVPFWTAWNEPNLPAYFRPPPGQRYTRANVTRAYARACNAVGGGVHSAQWPAVGEKVACGVTAPYFGGVRTLDFLRGMKLYRARFDAFAHHPHPGNRREAPSTRPRSNEAIRLGNIDVLIRELTRLYGRKPLWVTEYGYQTNPPDRFGVTWATQARWLKSAYAIARRNPRITMMIWFLACDERGTTGFFGVSGWQSGLATYDCARKKPAFWAFATLPR